MTLVHEVDLLYQRCVSQPERCGDQFFADWAESVASGHDMDRDTARLTRRCLRVGQRLAAFWREGDLDASVEWRSRVDIALGPRAWRPELELAQHLLAAEPSEERFDAVAALFPLVHNEPFLDGASYSDWVETEGSADSQ